jgi:hypothetical protein
MGMKRLEYQRYKKQFEFFCPFWCNNQKDLLNVKFVINLQNKNGRIMYSKVINFSNKIREYINNIYPSIEGTNDLNLEELLFINFNKMQSYIKGINIDKGVMQTVDTSYIVNNLLYIERPVLETDNMLANLFSTNKLVCPQLFNFNFVFDLDDFLPISFLDELILEKVNVFVDIYLGDEKCPMKDFYTNYEFIPKYDIYEGRYLEPDKFNPDKNNVLSYLQDYKALSLINKNKLSQGTFHWVLLNNQNSIFNLYNGFSPLYKGEPYCNAISNDAPDLMTDEFNMYKNPFGVFKYKNISEINEVIDSMKSGWITTGPKTKLFEKRLAEYCNTNKVVCLNSATAALEMTLRLLGIGKDDEVINTASNSRPFTLCIVVRMMVRASSCKMRCSL